MSSYILKKNPKDEEVLLYEEKTSYSFVPKKSYKWVKKITVLDTEILFKIWEQKISKDYNKLLKLIYALLQNDTADEGEARVCLAELNKLKKYILLLQQKGLNPEVIKMYLKKIYSLEIELQKIWTMKFAPEIERKSNGKSR